MSVLALHGVSASSGAAPSPETLSGSGLTLPGSGLDPSSFRASGVETFSCDDCSFSTSSLRKLGRHRSVNHSGTKYRCTECGFVTGYQSNFYRHRKQIHSNSSNAKMTVIPASNLQQEERVMGQPLSQGDADSSRDQKLPPFLPQMSMNGNDPGALMSMWSSSLLPMVQNQFNAFLFAQAAQAAAACLVAGGVASPYASSLASVMPSSGASPVSLPGASKSPEELVNDVISNLSPASSRTVPSPASQTSQKHCPIRTYSCPYNGCSHETRETREHLHHLRDVHDERISIFYCDYCSYASKTLAKVRRHASLIHRVDNHPSVSSPAPPVPLITPESHSVCTTSSESAESEETELHKCQDCKYTTTDAARFKKHLRCHQCYGPTMCEKCDFTTVYAWNLDRHVKSHSVPGRFSCFRCSFSQNTRQSMSFHLQHHHIISKADTESQTEPIEDPTEFKEMDSSSMGHEVFLFEHHAVKVNESYDPNAGEESNGIDAVHPNGQENQTTVRKTPNATITVSNALPASKGGLGGISSPSKDSGPKKMVSESDIIESPAEPQDLREYEAIDPDVRKRTCSVCGYQGKWISEMVRHKRVHTNERPFKCKYCSRTSKWKADLIRHVAKAHGIKVVSKYSRGANFSHLSAKVHGRSCTSLDGNAANSQSPNGQNLSKFGDSATDPGSNPRLFPQQGTEILNQSEQSKRGGSEPPTLREAQLLEYFRSHGAMSPSVAPTGTSSSDAEMGSNCSLSPFHPPAGLSQDADAVVDKYLDNMFRGLSGSAWKCKLCGFECLTMEQFQAHAISHETGPKPYACSACSYRSNWSSDVHKHIRLNAATHEVAYVVKNQPSSDPEPEKTARRAIPGVASWVCVKCGFTHEGRTEVIEHLTREHSLPAYGCPVCNFSSLYRKACVFHVTSVHALTEDRVVENVAEVKNEDSGKKSEKDQYPKRPLENSISAPISVPPKKRKLEKSMDFESRDNNASHHMKCNLCPFSTDNVTDLLQHIGAHEIPKAPLAYKCCFCPFYSRRKQQIQSHMFLHTSDPEPYMPVVERNLITPMSHSGDGPHQPDPTKRGSEPGQEPLDQPLDLSAKKGSSPKPPTAHSVIVPTPIRPEPIKGASPYGLDDLRDVFREFEALLPQEECSPKLTNLSTDMDGSQISPAFSDKGLSSPTWNRPDDDQEEPVDLIPRTAEIQKVDILIDGKESKVWQCRYCLHTSKRRANVRLHERKHFKRALKGASFCRCPQCEFQGARDAVLDHMISEHSDNCHLLGRTGERVKTPKRFTSAIPKSTVSMKTADFSSPKAGPERAKHDHVHVTPKPKNHTCPNCPAKFTDRAQLMRHERFHGTDMRYKCHMCNYSVPFPINLTKHYKSHHKVGIIVTGNGTRQTAVAETNPEAPQIAATAVVGNESDFDAAETTFENAAELGLAMAEPESIVGEEKADLSFTCVPKDTGPTLSPTESDPSETNGLESVLKSSLAKTSTDPSCDIVIKAEPIQIKQELSGIEIKTEPAENLAKNPELKIGDCVSKKSDTHMSNGWNDDEHLKIRFSESKKSDPDQNDQFSLTGVPLSPISDAELGEIQDDPESDPENDSLLIDA